MNKQLMRYALVFLILDLITIAYAANRLGYGRSDWMAITELAVVATVCWATLAGIAALALGIILIAIDLVIECLEFVGNALASLPKIADELKLIRERLEKETKSEEDPGKITSS